jgi:large subunit ribosomal protein L18
MKHLVKKKMMRDRRRRRIRGRLSGTGARPRLAVHRTLQQIYAQIVDDDRGVTLCQASSLEMGRKGGLGDAKGGAISGAKAVGAEIAKRAKAAGIESVAFDRAGRRYHGRVKALADAAREAGLKF